MDEGVLDWSVENLSPMDSCVGCRACETACPSGVKYGEILELVRSQFLKQGDGKRGLRQLLWVMSDPLALRAQLWLSQVFGMARMPRVFGKLFSSDPQEADIPSLPEFCGWPPLEDHGLPPIKGEVALLEGCAMSVLYPDVHEATIRLLRRVGYRAVRVKGCCGALHAHNGLLQEAHQKVKQITNSVPTEMPIVANSAGCGGWLKETGPQTFDASEFLFDNGLLELLRASPGLNATLAYHEACHLAHGQKIKEQPRLLLQAIPGLRMIELNEAEMCCGSGGVYNLLQPRLARKMLNRKWSNIADTGANIVATGNPGCHAWIAQAATENGGNVQVLHTISLLEASFLGCLP